jgi:hypothetical protein
MTLLLSPLGKKVKRTGVLFSRGGTDMGSERIRL